VALSSRGLIYAFQTSNCCLALIDSKEGKLGFYFYLTLVDFPRIEPTIIEYMEQSTLLSYHNNFKIRGWSCVLNCQNLEIFKLGLLDPFFGNKQIFWQNLLSIVVGVISVYEVLLHFECQRSTKFALHIAIEVVCISIELIIYMKGVKTFARIRLYNDWPIPISEIYKNTTL
jgi:uncharacterized membrane protein YuzA (DUF378 family)